MVITKTEFTDQDRMIPIMVVRPMNEEPMAVITGITIPVIHKTVKTIKGLKMMIARQKTKPAKKF